MHIHQENISEFVGRDIRVYLNGVQMSDIFIEANSDEGYIIFPVLDIDGWIIADPVTDGLLQYKVTGVVDIVEGAPIASDRLGQISERVWKRQAAH
jgi:hypothetical protein